MSHLLNFHYEAELRVVLSTETKSSVPAMKEQYEDIIVWRARTNTPTMIETLFTPSQETIRLSPESVVRERDALLSSARAPSRF